MNFNDFKKLNESPDLLKKTKNVQFNYNKELNPIFWNNYIFDESIRQKLITIATEFYNNLKFDTKINDIILTGSLANFNYNKYSDLDIHIIVDFNKINKNNKLVKKTIDYYRFIWNLKHNIKIKGHDVELYIQDINEKHKSSGMYSLMNSKWIIKPKYKKPEIDNEKVNFKFLTFKSGIDRLDKISNEKMSSKLAKKYYLFALNYKKRIHKLRKNDLEKYGEFSVNNLVFKKLRNSGHFGKLINIINKLYDKIYIQ